MAGDSWPMEEGLMDTILWELHLTSKSFRERICPVLQQTSRTTARCWRFPEPYPTGPMHSLRSGLDHACTGQTEEALTQRLDERPN